MSIDQLILSLAAILMVCRLFGWLCRFIGQPKVVGEMIAGIVLGPSLLGNVSPSLFGLLFPASSLNTLTALSQIGLLLFMFVVGLEVDFERILKQRISVVLISNCSILLPLASGAALAGSLYSQFAGAHVGFPSYALFMGTAMSITAFPVLARILKERRLLGTEVGAVAISCAAIDDVTAWFLFAVLTATLHSAGNWLRVAETLLLLSIFIIVVLFPVRKTIAWFHSRSIRAGSQVSLFFVFILFMLATSWTTERLGIHPLFGAFLSGLVVPRTAKLAAVISERIESLTLALLLPLFFALTGLRTRIDGIAGTHQWVPALLILLIAISGKLMGASFTARLTGMSWKTSLGLGILMNTRGLVELVVLNTALELGIISPPLFTMMVMMALLTTIMTTPLLALLGLGGTEKAPLAMAMSFPKSDTQPG
jgi:Kef-type K+ transport system membrane component KefB